jgi:hypothetical protein
MTGDLSVRQESYAASMSTQPGSDPIGDFQRWLMRAGARSIGRDVADRVKSTLGGSKNKNESVWETATTEELVEEPPECQWCPICRAARRYRDGGGSTATLSGQFAGVSDTLAGLTRDAFSLFESAMRTPPRPAPSSPSSPSAPSRPASAQDRAGATWDSATSESASAASTASASSDTASSDDGTVVGPGIGWPSVVHSKHEDYEAGHERGHGQESGEPGDGGADRGTDEQVEGTAE